MDGYAYSDAKLTPDQKAVFGYFNAIGSVPDYDFWIRSESGFGYIPERERTDYVVERTLELGNAYSAYDPDKDLIELHTDVIVKHSSGSEEKKPHIVFEFFESSDSSYIPSFDFRYGVDTIALVVNELAVFSDMELEQAQNAAIAEKVPLSDDYFNAKLTIHVRPSRASSSTPIVEEGHRKWVMVGDIAYIKCRASSNGETLWDYTAPWYEEIKKQETMTDAEKYPHPYDLFKD